MALCVAGQPAKFTAKGRSHFMHERRLHRLAAVWRCALAARDVLLRVSAERHLTHPKPVVA